MRSWPLNGLGSWPTNELNPTIGNFDMRPSPFKTAPKPTSRENRRGIMTCAPSHKELEADPQNMDTQGNAELPPRTSCSTHSIDITVALGSISVSPGNSCAMHSWTSHAGTLCGGRFSIDCCDIVRATNLLTMSPCTIPRHLHLASGAQSTVPISQLLGLTVGPVNTEHAKTERRRVEASHPKFRVCFSSPVTSLSQIGPSHPN